MRIILLIGTGSFIGGVFRYLASQFIQNRISTILPYGTLWVNIIGCFLVGLIYGISDRGGLNPDWRLFLATGICGGFTTFSAFSNDTISLMRDGQFIPAFIYLSTTVFFGLMATLIGIAIPKLI
ncbi:MAG TPA: fluoride efflux transporter CrcB [Cyclobacteriaceae bacterium]|nr:fluoride efflux transporter CrcB [Cyclobacteriaceae bacterium]